MTRFVTVPQNVAFDGVRATEIRLARDARKPRRNAYTGRMDWLRSLFVSHGAPSLAIEDSAPGQFLDELGNALGRPRALVVASAHFGAERPTVSAAAENATVHDFRGFPSELSRIAYDAPGSPRIAAAVVDLLRHRGFDAALDPERGLDHGVWVPLHRMFPRRDVPVIALSVSARGDAARHFELGAALAELADEEILVVGSGGFVHNLGELDWRYRETLPFEWAVEFSDWMREAITNNDLRRALAWRERAPHADVAHPTTEHLMPLFVAWGAAGPGARAYELHRTWQYGSLAMHAYAFR